MSTNKKTGTAQPPTGGKATKAPVTEKVNTTKKKAINLPFMLMLAGFVLFGILLFNAKLFLMGDDANYIIDGYNFIHRHTYPGQSSLYGIVLGILELISGINVLVLKCWSFVFSVIGFVTLYTIFRNRIDRKILYPVLIFSAINSTLQYYSSSNLSEAFFMMIQYLYTGTIFLLIEKSEEEGASIKKHWKYWLLAGFVGLLITLSKNIGIIIPLSPVIYFLCYKKWGNAIKALGAFLVFKIPYEILLRLTYHQTTGLNQMDQVLAKNLYHHEEGKETFTGFIQRFIDNTQIYLTNDTLKMFGFNIGATAAPIVTILFSALLVTALVFAFRKNKYVFFVSIYTFVLGGATFFALQPAVAQDRIIVILVPYLLLLLLFALTNLATRVNKQYPLVNKVVIYIFLGFIALANLKMSMSTAQDNLPVLQENLTGDPFYGYTPDWINYLEMGKWVEENIPQTELVAARKPNSLSVYTSLRDFYGIYSFPRNEDADQLLQHLRDNNVHYLILASLRANASIAQPNNIISTIHNYVTKIAQKYPKSVQIVHTTGTAEPCYLVKITYPPLPAGTVPAPAK